MSIFRELELQPYMGTIPPLIIEQPLT